MASLRLAALLNMRLETVKCNLGFYQQQQGLEAHRMGVEQFPGWEEQPQPVLQFLPGQH